MYSFRDAAIIEALGAAVARGVRVRLLFESANGDHRSPAGTRSAQLEDLGVDVRYVNMIMHHKFAIFDGPQDDPAAARTATLATSSGNWSFSAGTRFDENTLVLRGHPEAALSYQAEFNHLWEHSRDLVWNPDVEFFTTRTLTPQDLAAFDTDALEAVFTSANFERFESARYGPGFRTVRGVSVVADRLVSLIESAERSVHIASGHLRSRPISEALMKLAQDRPEVDIRIYLDGQEYISEGYHRQQLRELAECLDGAGSSDAARSDCLDRGFHFGYQAHLEGAQVRYKYYAYRWDYTYAIQMHHKYLLVDGRWVATGSYNYSDNAEHNTMENVLILDGEAFPEVVRGFEENFETLWRTGEADRAYEGLLEEVRFGQDDVRLVFEPVALDWDQVTELKAALRAACPDVTTEPFRRDPRAHQTCARL